MEIGFSLVATKVEMGNCNGFVGLDCSMAAPTVVVLAMLVVQSHDLVGTNVGIF